MTISEVRWDWDPNKAEKNFKKHGGVSFEVAALALNTDPYHLSKIDLDSHEVRFITLAQIQNVLLVIVHTEPETERSSGTEVGRIISARRATPSERRAYANGQ